VRSESSDNVMHAIMDAAMDAITVAHNRIINHPDLISYPTPERKKEEEVAKVFYLTIIFGGDAAYAASPFLPLNQWKSS